MKKRRPSFKSRNYYDIKEGIDYDAYYELEENGLNDRDIAYEMNIPESFLENIKHQAKE
jgi:hypothetical protein